MEILGIGMPELIFVVIIALLILGPKDMQKAGKTIGKFLRDIITSDGWKLFQQTSRDLRTLPNRLIREANEDLDKVNREIKSAASAPDPARSAPANSRPQPQPYSATSPIKPGGENVILPNPQEKNNPESETPNNA
ncbi:MAG TPA: twin-arginine translocase TatA/TatE family subunit [Anaerolineales bacterium]|nr:twin-arginine translocase TatA/TatE family subunit [Anaerolineales bacterium]